MKDLTIHRITGARVPTAVGEFTLCVYVNELDAKEHLALIMGDVAAQERVLVRLHSECFTGDVLGSLRCDCGDQLQRAMGMIAAEGTGVILYLRQEGRGIGLPEKLRAYNLQDQGFDTVDANIMLGHRPDERDYSVAALMLADLGVRSVRLLTNNPAKIAGLQAAGVASIDRVPLQPSVTPHNSFYLSTKAARMGHMVDVDTLPRTERAAPTGPVDALARALAGFDLRGAGRPFVTVTYAQSLDGSIDLAHRPGAPRSPGLAISGPEAKAMTHRLRAMHDGILVGVGTVIADNPHLTARLAGGPGPQPIVLDTCLRTPPAARLLGRRPWLLCGTDAPANRQEALEAAGARVIRLPAASGRVHLPAALSSLAALGITGLMVEGGAQVITSFLALSLADYLIVTVAPILAGGFNALASPFATTAEDLVRLRDARWETFGDDMVIGGRPQFGDGGQS